MKERYVYVHSDTTHNKRIDKYRERCYVEWLRFLAKFFSKYAGHQIRLKPRLFQLCVDEELRAMWQAMIRYNLIIILHRENTRTFKNK